MLFMRTTNEHMLLQIMKRRDFVNSAIVTGLASTPLGNAIASQGTLPRTPGDYEGPYYPVGERHRTTDLLVGEPRETVLHFRGEVVDVHGDPHAGVLVDIWHADPLGRYDHPRDRSPGERWEEFLYWGEAATDNDGKFEFRTYVPGEYGRRPAHIHYKVWRDRTHLLTSQVYFSQLGGARDAARSKSNSDLQTVDLEPSGNAVSCHLRVVI